MEIIKKFLDLCAYLGILAVACFGLGYFWGYL